MAMTITERIFAQKSGREKVKAGELLFAKLDLVMGTDVTAPLSIKVFQQMEAQKVFHKEKIALINDHFVPAKDIASAELSRSMREFSRKQGIKYYYEVGRSGICHTLVPEEGLVVPGDLVVGADSHTCTYGALGAFATGIGSTDQAAAWALGELWFRVPASIKVVFRGKLPEMVGGKDIILFLLGKLGVEGAIYKALEFRGEVIDKLPMADRFTICNMAIEAGAKSGIIKADDITLDYLKGRTERKPLLHRSDIDAHYEQVIELNISSLEPQVALPYLASNVKPISKLDRTKIDQVLLGSCTNGRIEDFRIAASLLKGRRIHPEVRLLAIPSSNETYRKMIEEGIVEILMDAGAVISTPTCGPCLGGHMGVLGKGEKGLFTSNRNFVGRCGHKESQVFLAGPAVAAATAIKGYISDPRKL